MNFKIIGSVLVFLGCGSFGFKLAASHLREEKTLRQLIAVLDYMECELLYHLTPLPALCRQAAVESGGVIRQIFLSLSQELEDQISPNVEQCMTAALSNIRDMPKLTGEIMILLGHSLGRFDLEGQIKGLEAARQECGRFLDGLNQNKDVRLRSYQTLGLCAGAAIVILFI